MKRGKYECLGDYSPHIKGDIMGSYYDNVLIIRGKSEDIYRFFKNEYRSLNYVGFDIEGENLPDLDKTIDDYDQTYCEIHLETKWTPTPFCELCDEELFEDYNSLKIEAYVASQDYGWKYFFYGDNSGKSNATWIDKSSYEWEGNKKRYNPDRISKSSQKLEKLNKKFKLIRKDDNVVIFGDDETNGWKEFASERCGIGGFVLTETEGMILNEKPNSSDRLKANAILSNKSPNFTGIKERDIKKSLELTNTLIEFGEINLAENGNLVFKIIRDSEFESIIKSLKSKFRHVYQYQFPKSSQTYVIAKGFKRDELEMRTLVEKYNLIKKDDEVLIYAEDEIDGWEKVALKKSKNVKSISKKEKLATTEKSKMILFKAQYRFEDDDSIINHLKKDGNMIIKHSSYMDYDSMWKHNITKSDPIFKEIESKFKSVKLESFKIHQYGYYSYPFEKTETEYFEDYIIGIGYLGESLQKP